MIDYFRIVRDLERSLVARSNLAPMIMCILQRPERFPADVVAHVRRNVLAGRHGTIRPDGYVDHVVLWYSYHHGMPCPLLYDSPSWESWCSA